MMLNIKLLTMDSLNSPLKCECLMEEVLNGLLVDGFRKTSLMVLLFVGGA